MERHLIMSFPLKITLTCLLATTLGCGRDQVDPVVDIPPGISWASLLADASDMGNLAVPIPPGATSTMYSSCLDSNKVMLANLAPKILGDMDHGFFKEVVDDKDGVRATIAEFDGPGVVTWVWSANPTGTIGLFIDGQEAPAIRMSFDDFLGGRFLPVRDPYASVTSLGHNLHFPIVHTSHCKLVVWVPKRENLAELFYQVAWQALPRNSVIHPFNVADIRTNAQVLKQLSRRILTMSKTNGPRADEGDKITRTECLLEPGWTAEVFRATGVTAITCIRFTAKSRADLKSLWLDGIWDGVTSVHAPLHMLAGVSDGLEDTESLPATVDSPQVTLRWFMPCGAEDRLLVGNTSSETSRVKVEVWSRPIDATKYPLRFHANYLRHVGMQTDGGNILTLAEVAGSGRFVGCVLGVDSRSDQWWGEGDHMIWLDDPDRQAWHGTGTEDYFGFAWCSQGIFNHPFRGQTMVAGDQSHRIAHVHRYHILDQLPFRRWGRFQFEAWGLGKGEMDWTTTIMWYSMEGKPIKEEPIKTEGSGTVNQNEGVQAGPQWALQTWKSSSSAISLRWQAVTNLLTPGMTYSEVRKVLGDRTLTFRTHGMVIGGGGGTIEKWGWEYSFPDGRVNLYADGWQEDSAHPDIWTYRSAGYSRVAQHIQTPGTNCEDDVKVTIE